MEVKCALCDKVEKLDDESALAKKLRNRPIHTYMCDDCRKRITERTEERYKHEDYKVFHRGTKSEDEW